MRYIATVLALICLKTYVEVINGFVSPLQTHQRVSRRAPTTALLDADTDEDSLASTSSVIWNWNAANSSLGSLLLRLQKEEEEEMKRAVGQTTNATAITEPPAHIASPPPSPPSPPRQSELTPMDLETARELDDAVSKRSKENLLEGIEVLPTPSLYSTLSKTKKQPPSASRTRLFRRIKQEEDEEEEFDVELINMPLSLPEHYDERIGRDMRHLSVSIASNVDEVWQWRLFCREKGGIVPLLKCIQEGAKRIQERVNKVGSRDSQFAEFADEETFMAACTACRALRDLCAISPELSAVITDGILRANDLWGTDGPLSDFVTLFHHATDVELKREAREIFRLNRRNRRGEFFSKALCSVISPRIKLYSQFETYLTT